MKQSQKVMLPKPLTRLYPCWKLQEHIDNRNIFLDAPYQRDIVWNTHQMSDLIDSIFNNYYVPALVFVARRINGRTIRIVVDGKQRLTSIYRFMKNEIPYIDHSSGAPVERYYNGGDQVPGMDNKEYLDQDMIDTFSSFEFVCVEYSNISEDEEYEIFSRVQLGVNITSAEKLKAHNTPISKFCIKLTQEYNKIDKLLEKHSNAYVFKAIAQILCVLTYGGDEFKATPKGIETFVTSDTPIDDHKKQRLRQVLSTLSDMAHDPDCYEAFTKRNGARYRLRTLELVSFAYYISLVNRVRTLQDYAKDFTELRDYVFRERDGKVYFSRDAFISLAKWADERVENLNLRQARVNRPYVYEVEYEDEDEDELKLDEYEPETPVIPSKRRKESRGSKPVARRGGRAPR